MYILKVVGSKVVSSNWSNIQDTDDTVTEINLIFKMSFICTVSQIAFICKMTVEIEQILGSGGDLLEK